MNEHSLSTKMTRKELIIQTARKLIVQNGLYDTSVAKIAKEAQIPVGSVYTYFSTKEEMIDEIYKSIKLEMAHEIFKTENKEMNIYEQFALFWHNAVNFGLENEEKFLFVEQFSNSPLILKTTQEEINHEFAHFCELIEKGIAQGILKPLDSTLIHHLVYQQIIGATKFFNQNKSMITNELKEQFFACCWDSITLNQITK